MDPMPSIEEVPNESEVPWNASVLIAIAEDTQRSTTAGEAPLPTSFHDGHSKEESESESESESASERDWTPMSEPKVKPRSYYIDQFSLQQPPPPSKLYGGENLDDLTGRREYFKEDRALLPFHHDPSTYLPSTRRLVATSGYDTIQEAIAMKEALMEHSRRERVDHGEELLKLDRIIHFAYRSCNITSTDQLGRRSEEDQMEGMLKEFGLDKMKPPVRKVEGASAEPYVPFPGRNMDCQRSAGTLPRKGLDETKP
ncbi:MAG: hypothetical protein Q9168_000144 [Polycauliona sp. 1 TL-2023]